MVIYKVEEKNEINNEVFVESLEVYLNSKILRRVNVFIKRTFDILLSVFGIIVFLPVALVISAAILIEDGMPIMFKQIRTGRDWKDFWFLKFRSMEKNSERIGPMLVQVNDGRVTKVGKIIRSMALDELPQLINILKGDLSFVGPRPERPELISEIIKIHPGFTIRNIVRPGLTGMAQVYGNYDSNPYKKLKYDLFYIQKWSFWLDVKLLFKSLWITFQAAWNKRSKRIRFLKQKTRKIKSIINKN